MINFNKPKRHVDKVFIHCSASDNAAHDNLQTITDWHVKDNGWSDIGYHFVITKDGQPHWGRFIETTPAAQKHHNTGSIAICLTGLNKFSEEQFIALRQLCAMINEAYEGEITFHGHNEVSTKSCPVFDYKTILGLDDEGRLPDGLIKPTLPIEKEAIMPEETQVQTPVKAGAKTSEFWLTLATTVVTFAVTILNQVFDWGINPESVLSAVTPVLVYILGRSGVKALAK